MMVKRNTVNKANFEKFKNSEGRTLSEVIDKGFPYDDADFELTGAINSIKKKCQLVQFSDNWMEKILQKKHSLTLLRTDLAQSHNPSSKSDLKRETPTILALFSILTSLEVPSRILLLTNQLQLLLSLPSRRKVMLTSLHRCLILMSLEVH